MSAARTRTALFILVLAALLLAAGARVGGADAATDHVTDCGNSGAGTLRNVVAASATGDTIVFDQDCTITLTSAIAVPAFHSITIDGTGHSIVISGGDATVLFTVGNVNALTLDHLTLTHGSGSPGGAINSSGALTVQNSTVTNNTSSATAGAIDAQGPLTITNSFFGSNSAASGFGGAIRTESTATIQTTTFSDNHSDATSAAGGAIANFGTLTIDRSTFSGNTANGSAGIGGAIYNQFNPLTIRNSTLTGNSADSGGAIYKSSGGSVTLQNDTVSGNSATSSTGGIDVAFGTVDVANTIVSGNTGGNCGGSITDNGNNLQFGDSTCGFSLTSDPQLGSLAFNGGPTKTMALGTGSTAIGAGSSTVCLSAGIGDVDQRGSARRAGSRGFCDIGAYDTGGTTLHVQNCNATGTGSLVDDVAAALTGDTIVFDQDCTGASQILLGGATMNIAGITLTIDGTGHNVTVSGGGTSIRMFTVQGGATLTVDHLTLADANSSEGAAFLNHGTLTVKNSTLQDNSTSDNGGAINSDGTLTVEGSTFNNNESGVGNGGAINNDGTGTATIRTSTFNGNDSRDDDEFGTGGGAINNFGSLLTVDRSTFKLNGAPFGGAIASTGQLILRNSTLNGNFSEQGGGVLVASGAAATLQNDTISGNNASSAGSQIDNLGPGALNVSNTVVSGGGGNCAGTVTDQGHNLQFGDSTCGFSLTANPLLGSLGNNGGPTETMSLGGGSPAIHAGDATVCQNAGIGNVDQRGSSRNAGLRAHCDIGAYDTGGVGEAAPGTTTIERSPKQIVADGSSTATITVVARDTGGSRVFTGGATVILNTTRGTLGTVTDQGNGLYTATLTSSTTVGLAVVSGTLNGDPITATRGIDFVPGPPSGANSRISRGAGSIVADGTSTSTITVRAKDANGYVIQVGGATVVLQTTRGSVSTATDNGNGTYTALLTSATVNGTAHVTGTINGNPIASSVDVDFVPGPPSGSTTNLTRNPSRITAGGASTATIMVRARDQFENLIQVGGATVVLNTTLGSISAATDHGNGIYTATLTSSVTRGKATVSGTINGDPIAVTVGVDFVPGPAAGSMTFMTRTPTSIPANGSSTSTITVIACDQYGNRLQTGGATVILHTSRGSLGGVTDLGNGRYKATLTSSNSPGTAVITGTINAQAIGTGTSVSFT